MLRSVSGVLLLAFVLSGCGSHPDPAPPLSSVGGLKLALADIRAALEAGDIEAVDAVMHRKDFSQGLGALKQLAEHPALSSESRKAVQEAGQRILLEVRRVHQEAPAHGGGGIEAIDVPSAIGNFQEAMSDLEAALPEGWALPAVDAVANEHHGSHDYQQGDHDEASHIHAGHDHAHQDQSKDVQGSGTHTDHGQE